MSAQASEPTRFAASVAAMGMLLRGSPYHGSATMQRVRDTAGEAMRYDPSRQRRQFVGIVDKAIELEGGVVGDNEAGE